MKVSLNWIRDLNQKYQCAADPAPNGIDKLVEKIGAQLGAIEEVIDLGKKYDKALVVKVVECQKHPDADKLSVCKIDAGRKELIQVVCGAPNVKVGMLAVWLPPGATVPSTYNKDPFVLEAREIRGQISNGMLASAKELDLGDDHNGILQVDDNFQVGIPFDEAYGLDDYIIDIENKMFTHRPDLFGQLGIARELAGIQHHAFKSPNWYRQDAGIMTDGRNNGLKLEVKNTVPELVPRFCAVAMKDIKVAPSHLELQILLLKLGVRPINNIVDITNFVMLLTGQPMHAYDYDKLKTGVLGVRQSKDGEKLTVIGGKEITLKKGTVVITDGDKPIGLGGVMGGASTEVDENTRNIILESANFDMNSTRRAAMEYGLFTDAATRFTKNQSPLQNMAAMARAVEKVKKRAGGRIASRLVDVKSYKTREMSVKTDLNFINGRLGLSLAAAEVKKLLQNVEFDVKTQDEKISVSAPFWRTDIEIPEDIVEEVGRLYGYDKLPVVLPKRDLAPAEKDVPLQFKSQLRNLMSKAGANEVLTYSFVHERLLKAAGQDPAEAFHIRNALSPDLQYYRLNLLPSLLEKVRLNVKNGYDAFTIFEIGKGHVKGMLNDDKLPLEPEWLAAVAVNPYAKGAPYYQAVTIADHLFDRLNISEKVFVPLPEAKLKIKSSLLNCYEPARTAVVWGNGRALGLVGEPSQALRLALKLPAGTSMFELEIPNLYETSQPLTYRPLNKFPPVSEDICLRMSSDIPYEQADDFMWGQLERLAAKHGYEYSISALDIFQKPGDKKHRQTTWRIILWHPERTLTTNEVNKLMDELVVKAKQELKAERI